MEVQEFMRIVIYICTLLFGGLALWYQGNAKVSGRVAALIQRAEVLYSDWTKAGGVKFEWVVGRLYDLLPLAVRPFVPRSHRCNQCADLLHLLFQCVDPMILPVVLCGQTLVLCFQPPAKLIMLGPRDNRCIHVYHPPAQRRGCVICEH